MKQADSTHSLAMTRREFSLAAAGAGLADRGREPKKALVVVAHPDDEHVVAATVYRMAKELGWTVDQVVISNGEGGYRYAALAELYYGIALTDEQTGRARLPEIRRRETLAAGRILGIRNHHWLGERDGGHTLEEGDAYTDWDAGRVERFLRELMEEESYEYVFTMLPHESTHGHHKAAAELALKAARALRPEERPVVLGAEAGALADAAPGRPFEFERTRRFGFRDALDYTIVVNWVIAEHKSQGLFQTETGRHDVERFWVLGPAAGRARAERLFEQLKARA